MCLIVSGSDKRASMENVPPNVPKRSHKHPLPDENHPQSSTPDLRDSGISTASLSELSGALNNLSYEEYHPATCHYNSDSRDFNGTPDLNNGYIAAMSSTFKLEQFMNIVPDADLDIDDGPPPIPPKIGTMDKSDSILSDSYVNSKLKIQDNGEH